MTLFSTEPNGILLETEPSVPRANFRTLRPVWGVSGMHVSSWRDCSLDSKLKAVHIDLQFQFESFRDLEVATGLGGKK